MLVAACGTGGVLAAGGRLPWHLPEDVARFRAACVGRHLLVGRRTWQEMQGWFRPDHTPLVLTHQRSLHVPGGRAVADVPEAIAAARDDGADELVVIGGGATYAAALPFAACLLLTEVHGSFAGDVFFPAWQPSDWEELDRFHHPADAAHSHAFTIRRLQRRQPHLFPR